MEWLTWAGRAGSIGLSGPSEYLLRQAKPRHNSVCRLVRTLVSPGVVHGRKSAGALLGHVSSKLIGCEGKVSFAGKLSRNLCEILEPADGRDDLCRRVNESPKETAWLQTKSCKGPEVESHDPPVGGNGIDQGLTGAGTEVCKLMHQPFASLGWVGQSMLRAHGGLVQELIEIFYCPKGIAASVVD
jgi:hypothetical protein